MTEERLSSRQGTEIYRSNAVPGDATPAPRASVVFIHGVGLNHRVWNPQVQSFSADYDVLRYDTLGHGNSRLPPADSDFSPWIAQLLDVLDSAEVDRANLVGHSMGAIISVAFAIAYPTRVATITPIAAVYDRTPEHVERAKNTAAALFADGPQANLESALNRWFTDDDRSHPQRNRAIDVCRQFLRDAHPIGYARAYRALAHHADDFRDQLCRIACPALYVSAEFDPNSTPSMSAAMASATPLGEAVDIKNERHMLPLIAQEKLDPIVMEFINRNGGVNSPPQS